MALFSKPTANTFNLKGVNMDNILFILIETTLRHLFSRLVFTRLSLSKSELFTKEVLSDRDNFPSSSAQPVTNATKSQPPKTLPRLPVTPAGSGFHFGFKQRHLVAPKLHWH